MIGRKCDIVTNPDAEDVLVFSVGVFTCVIRIKIKQVENFQSNFLKYTPNLIELSLFEYWSIKKTWAFRTRFSEEDPEV